VSTAEPEGRPELGSDELALHYRGRTVLVTGGTGFIGSAVVSALAGAGADVIACRGMSGRQQGTALPRGGVEIVEEDIRSAHFWDDLLSRVDVVFHLAAQTSSRFANEHPLEDLETNLLPVARFVEGCRRKAARPDLVFSGTSTQVGFTDSYPTDESSHDVPITVYDINKLAAEHYLHYYASEMRGRAVSLRLTNVYGPGPESRHHDRGILNMMIRRALAQQQLVVYGDGEYMRDFIYIDDVVAAFLSAGVRLGKTSGNYYVLGSAEGHTVRRMAETVQRLVAQVTDNPPVEIQHVPPPDGLPRIDYRHFVADSRRFRNDSGWEPRVSLVQGVTLTIRHFLAGPESVDDETDRDLG